MNTPAQSRANSISVETSSVAVRRGMDRPYGTALRALPGPVRTGDAARVRRVVGAVVGAVRVDAGPFVLAHGLTEPRVAASSDIRRAVRSRAAQLPHSRRSDRGDRGISNHAKDAMA